MRIAVIALTVLLLSASTADACGRCAIFGRGCRFAQKQIVVTKQSYGYQYQQPSNTTNLSLINVYPPGSVAYQSVAQLAQSYQVNPSLALELSAKAAGQALDNQAASIRLAQEHSAASQEIQRQALALQLVQAAMGTGQVQQQQTSSSLSLEVRQGTGVATDGGGSVQGGTAPARSLLATKCAQCHGLDLQSPKGQLYLDAEHTLTASDSVAASRVVSGLDVPEPMRDVIQSLTDAERCQLLIEIATLARR